MLPEEPQRSSTWAPRMVAWAEGPAPNHLAANTGLPDGSSSLPVCSACVSWHKSCRVLEPRCCSAQACQLLKPAALPPHAYAGQAVESASTSDPPISRSNSMTELNQQNSSCPNLRTAFELDTKWLTAQWLELKEKGQRNKESAIRDPTASTGRRTLPSVLQRRLMISGCFYNLSVERK